MPKITLSPSAIDLARSGAAGPEAQRIIKEHFGETGYTKKSTPNRFMEMSLEELSAIKFESVPSYEQKLYVDAMCAKTEEQGRELQRRFEQSRDR